MEVRRRRERAKGREGAGRIGREGRRDGRERERERERGREGGRECE